METVALDKASVPLMHAENVSALISDSGITRYRLTAKVWDVLNTSEGTVWYFPEGVYVEKFDSLFQVEASIEADTAYNFTKNSLWRLVKNVKVVNLEQREFTTSELFWNEKQERVYSDSLVCIKENDGETVIYGLGFWARQDMTKYTLYKILPSTFTVNENEPDSLSADTIKENYER